MWDISKCGASIAVSNWASTAAQTKATLDTAVSSLVSEPGDRVCYEVRLDRVRGPISIGWVIREVSAAVEDSLPGGIGSYPGTFAVDSIGMLAGTGNGWRRVYPRRIKLREGDVVGVALDTIAGTISYSVNGTDLGVAVTLPPSASAMLRPAVSLKYRGSQVSAAWFKDQFQMPVPQGYRCIGDSDVSGCGLDLTCARAATSSMQDALQGQDSCVAVEDCVIDDDADVDDEHALRDGYQQLARRRSSWSIPAGDDDDILDEDYILSF